MRKILALALAWALVAAPAYAQNVTPLPAPVVQMQANLITTDQTISNATWTKVLFNSIVGDTTHMSSGVYTPIVAGTYQVCGLGAATGTTITQISVAISKNGTITGTGVRQAQAVTVGLATAGVQSASPGCVLVPMNGSSDTLELDINAVGTGTIAVPNGLAEATLSAKWVSP